METQVDESEFTEEVLSSIAVIGSYNETVEESGGLVGAAVGSIIGGVLGSLISGIFAAGAAVGTGSPGVEENENKEKIEHAFETARGEKEGKRGLAQLAKKGKKRGQAQLVHN